MNKGTGNYINPLDPVYDLAYDPKGGSGILKAIIWETIKVPSFNCSTSFEQLDISNEWLLAYTWSETVNGIELIIQKPVILNANAIEEDIMDSLRKENIKFDTINWVTL